MSLLAHLVRAINNGSVEIIDLTAPLSSKTPILTLPEQFGQTWPFALTEISRYNDAGPAWYWNNISTGEHTGTHFDAPIHWITGRDGADVSQVPVKRLIAPAVVLDFARRRARRPRLPARTWARRGLAGRARAAARGRVATVPHRLGRPRQRPVGVRQQGPHPGHLGGLREVARRGDPDPGHRRGDRGDRRRCGALV